MRGQHPGLPQAQSRQQSGHNEMQSFQQQLMFKQLQELQRQQQMWQSGEELKQPNFMSQMSAMTRQTVPSQLPGVGNGLPLNDASNVTWQGEYAGNDLKILNSSQLAMHGAMNLPQRSGHSMHDLSNGFALPQDQVQTLQSFGFVPQQLDSSLYGLPVSGNRGWLNQYPQLHGFSQRQDLAEGMPKASGNVALSSLESSQNVYQQQLSLNLQDSQVPCRQNFPEKQLFNQLPADSSKNGISANFGQENPTVRSANPQEYSARQEQSYCQGNHQGKLSHVPSSSSVRLDPTEQKILFSSDDDTNWDIFGMTTNMTSGGYLNGNSLDGNSFPSFQGGSWSALMQSAVAEVSSNDTGLKEEWSGLSLQKTDTPSGNQTPNLGDIAKPQINWFSNSSQVPSSAGFGSMSTFQNGNVYNNDKKITGLQQPFVSTFQQSSAKFASVQTKAEQENTNYGSVQHALHFGSPNLHIPLSHQQNLPPCSSDILLSSKGDGWVSNDLQPSFVKGLFEVSGPGSSMQQDQVTTSLATGMWGMVPKGATSSVSNSVDGIEAGNCNLNPSHIQIAHDNFSKLSRSLNNYGSNEQYDQGKQLMPNSSQCTTVKENLGSNSLLQSKSSQAWESLPRNADKTSGDTYDKEQLRGSQKEQSNDNSHMSSHSHPDSSDSGGGVRGGVDANTSLNINQNLHGHAGKKGLVPRKFQYHPMGNKGFITEVNDPGKKSFFAQEHSQMPTGDSKNYKGYQQQTSTSNAMHVDKDHAQDAERTARDSNQANSSQDFRFPSFLGRPSVVSHQSQRSGQPSQNMLELINKVDQSRVGEAAKMFADQTLFSQGNEHTDGQTTNLHYNQPAPHQGFRLQLGPPFERQSISNNSMSSPRSLADGTQPRYQDGEEKAGTWLNTTAQDRSMHLMNDLPGSDEFDRHPAGSRKISNETLESNTQNKYSGGMPASQPHMQNQVQNQQTFGSSVSIPNEGAERTQFGVQGNSEMESKNHQSSISHIGNVINGSSQNMHSDLPTVVQPFKLASAQDVRSSLGSPSTPVMPQSCSPNFGSNVRSTSQLVADSRVPLQSSLAQQIGFSGNFHQLLSNLSAQRMNSNFLQKNMSSSLQQIGANSFRTSSWIPRKFDTQDNNKGPGTSTVGACISSQNQISEEERQGQDSSLQQFAPGSVSSHMQESPSNRVTDGSLATPSHSVKIDQKESGSHGQGVLGSLQRVHQTTSHDLGFVFRPPDSQNQNYPLLHQVQALKALEVDQNSRLGKRFKGTDGGMDSRFAGKLPQNLLGYSTDVRIPGSPADNELSAVVQRGSFPSNSRMLSFSATVIDDQSRNKNAQDTGMELSCQNLSDSKPNDYKSGQPPVPISALSSAKGTEVAPAKPQMALPWDEQRGTLKSGHASLMHDESRSLHPNAELASEHRLNSQASETTCSSNAGSDVRQTTCVSTSSDPSMLVDKLSAEGVDSNSAQKLKKRKSIELLPWHQEIIEGSHWLQSIRMADVDWARSANRLTEKVEDETETIDYGSSIFRSRKRLLLTTHLMQQLFPSVPAAILTEPATTGYELVMFLVAKLGLGDSCSLVSSLANGIGSCSTAENRRRGRFKTFERTGDEHFLKVLENFVGRTERLENDLLRFEKRASILDVRVECQDLERFSIINRFAKFHHQSSSTSESSRKTYPQRFVTAISTPGNPPESLVCLSL